MTCDIELPLGFNKIGFMSADGSILAAHACTACAIPISSPSSVTHEFKLMFCDLKGATVNPLLNNNLHSAAVKTLLPT
jgi:hypothetical protein